MLDNRAGVEDCVAADLGTDIDHCARHEDAARRYNNAWRENGGWMDDRGEYPTLCRDAIADAPPRPLTTYARHKCVRGTKREVRQQ
jgi:hypothetical protein